MKVLVIGSGGREHALVWKLHQSPRIEKLYCAPGNAGMLDIAECLDIAANDIDKLVEFAFEKAIDLTVVGPEEPLSLGIVDVFAEKGLRIFGPKAAAAKLESSKVFTKKFLKKYKIPSANYKVFTKKGAAKDYIDKIDMPCVIKADGLAAGKGVIVARTKSEARNAVDLIMKEKAFGVAGKKIVVEQFLEGEEASFIAFTDGNTILPLPSSQDHKAIFAQDRGPNTGGMGAYSPAPVITEAMTMRVMNEVMLPTIRGMAAEGRPYTGMLYAGLMIDGDDISVLEFNCRFGDPECQPLLFRLKSDLVDIFEATIDGRLAEINLAIDPRPAVCVVMASQGYPEEYVTGKLISGLVETASIKDVFVFHAGTTVRDHKIVTAGGRVLGVTALGATIDAAIDNVYKVVKMIDWQGCYYRHDIGYRAIRRSRKKNPAVGIVMGSDSDLSVMREAANLLKSLGILFEITISSAHRTPEQAADYAKSAMERGLKVIIAGAGMAAHLAGVLAAHTRLPVIGVPINSSPLNGLDSLLSTVQMPPGVPVATMAIGKAGARNAAVFAARILAIEDSKIFNNLEAFTEEMASQVARKNEKL